MSGDLNRQGIFRLEYSNRTSSKVIGPTTLKHAILSLLAEKDFPGVELWENTSNGGVCVNKTEINRYARELRKEAEAVCAEAKKQYKAAQEMLALTSKQYDL